MPQRHHPSWSEIRSAYLSEPDVYTAYAELYAPEQRDRIAERACCEATIPGYKEARAAQ